MKNRKTKGYTIIETMIAISLFLVVTMAGMAALLNANLVHQKSESMREVMDNMSFIMEDMSRNLRTGYNYHCGNTAGISTPQSCAGGAGIIAFEHQDGDPEDPNDQWVYKLEGPDIDHINIYKSTNRGIEWVQMNPEEVTLNIASFFKVTGAEPPPANTQQPFVTIKLEGNITFKDVVTPFVLQTSVSQRIIDNVYETEPQAD